ncbi:MAG: hypothetical protein GY832_03865 [Chloroflexi bacterium]|nr:hypothetical protein [Chloroflexota bacterium]
MSLSIRAICDLIAALTVSNGDQTVTIHDIDEVERGYPSANCPIAVILPSDDGGVASFTPGAMDSSGVMLWSISVLFIQKPDEQGQGWKQHSEAVATFVENFVQAIVDAYKSFCPYGMLQGITARRGIFEYSDARYYGAMFTISFRNLTRIS